MWLPALKNSFYTHKIYSSLRIIEINGYKIHEIHWLPDGIAKILSLDTVQDIESLPITLKHTTLRIYYNEL